MISTHTHTQCYCHLNEQQIRIKLREKKHVLWSCHGSVNVFEESGFLVKQTGTRIIVNALICIVMSSCDSNMRHIAESGIFKMLNIILSGIGSISINSWKFECHLLWRRLGEWGLLVKLQCVCVRCLWHAHLTVLNDYRFNIHDHQLSAKLAHSILITFNSCANKLRWCVCCCFYCCVHSSDACQRELRTATALDKITSTHNLHTMTNRRHLINA